MKLDPDASIFDRHRLFSDTAIWTSVFLGLAVLVAVASALWEPSGYLVERLAGARFVVVIAAALYGLMIGWMVFPRLGHAMDD